MISLSHADALGLPIDLWTRVEKALAKLFSEKVYVKANALMSLGLDSYMRRLVLSSLSGSVLDIGCGDCHYCEDYPELELICIDPLFPAEKRVFTERCNKHRVVGTAEYLPLRPRSVDSAIAFFSFRDFFNKARAIVNMKKVARKNTCIVDIFHPRGLRRILLYAHLRIVAPILARIASRGKDYKWSMIYETILYMPSTEGFVRLTKGYYQKSIGGFLSIVCFRQ